MRAIVLLSGGLDSTTCLAYAIRQGFHCHALSFDYQQRHAAELAAATRIAKHYQVPHSIIPLAINQFGNSALTDPAIDVPEYNAEADIPVTYVPARNTIFLAYALALAEVQQANHIFIGVSAIDYSGYPDCRPEFIEAFCKLANLATKAAVNGEQIHCHTPLLTLSKAETIALGQSLGVDYSLTVSCYQADRNGLACGHCASCVLRKQGFVAANLKDPTRYQTA